MNSEIPKIARGIEWLLARQHRDGSWGAPSDPDIDRLITTCQVVTLLVDLGYPIESKIIRNAVKFLSHERFFKYETKGAIVTYWRLEPFSRLLHHYSELKQIINKELEIIYDRVKKGRGPSHHFVLPLYAIKIIYLLNLQEEKKEWLNLFVKQAINQWDGKEKCFSDRADMTSMGWTWLQRVDWPKDISDMKEEILRDTKEYIIHKADENEVEASWRYGYIATTAFVCINIAEAEIKDRKLTELVIKARKYLLGKQKPKGFWEPTEGEKPPQIKSNEYYTAVALRGIISSYKVENYEIIPAIWSNIAEKCKRRESFSTLVATLLGIVFVFYFGTRLIYSLQSVLHGISVFDLVGIALGFLGASPAIKSIFQWLRKKL